MNDGAEFHSNVLEAAILRDVPGAINAHVEGEYAYVEYDNQAHITRYRLSPEAQRIALLEREGRPLDIHIGPVDLLPIDDNEPERRDQG